MREEQCAVIRFLGSEGEKPADIHRRMKRQYGDACVSLQQVYEWRRKFKSGVSTLTDAACSGKLMLTLFWDYKGPILEHYMPRGLTINSDSYCDLLQNHLKPAIRSKHRSLLSSGVLLQHDNVCPYTAHATTKKITDLHLECIPHPAYSLDLALSDYHVFGPLKETLGGKKFSTDNEIKEVVHRWLHSQSEEFFLTESRH
jgi:histone-lysine N-methyltransferase SETMAR